LLAVIVMKSKISIDIDSELLDIIKDCSESDLGSIIQDALAQFFGVRQIWVRSDTLDPISAIPVKIDKALDASVDIASINNASVDTVKKRRKPKFVLKVWDKIKEELGTEFTTDDYWDATKKCGLNYKDSARHSTILEHLRLIEGTGNIVKINDRPGRYRKSESLESKGPELEQLETKGSELEQLETKLPIPKLIE